MTPIKAVLLDEFVAALAYPQIVGVTLVLLMWARVLTWEALWFCRCRCHEYVFANTAWSRRRQVTEYLKVSAGCVHRGRRLIEMVCGYIDRLIDKMSETWCPELQKHLQQLSHASREQLLIFCKDLRNRLCTRLRSKYSFVKKPPYIFLAPVGAEMMRLFGHSAVTTVDKARELVLSGLAQRDAVADVVSLDRVTRRLSVGSDNPHAVALEAFARGDVDQLDLSTEVLLRDYSLGKVITIATEGAHGQIKIYLAKKVPVFSLRRCRRRRRRRRRFSGMSKFMSFMFTLLIWESMS